jgi:signal transduction histidine kinase
MLSNLIENACKYAVKDSVIMVNVASVQEWISIQVTNETSIGFPDENRLFERYYRSENAHRITGSGLGLVLIKKLANIFEGDVVYSHDDRHVTFTVKVKR